MATPNVNDGTLGVDLTKHPTRLTTGSNYPEFPVGKIVRGDNGSLWQYGVAVSSIGANLWVAINQLGHAKRLTHVLASAVNTIGINEIAATTSGQYGWFLVGGPATTGGRVLGSCAPNATLYTTATAGVLDDACGVSGNIVAGAKITASNTTAASAVKAALLGPGGAVFVKPVT